MLVKTGSVEVMTAIFDARDVTLDTEHVENGLDLGPTIGEGGMGVVCSATQQSLGRRVAVKTVRPGEVDRGARRRLLREARVTGLLEHPNIVPVYDLRVDDEGSPALTMKLIEGFSWSELVRDAATVKTLFGVDDLLEWNVRTLMHVCNAVSFAHSRGIVHRDIKPDNVMVGRFGEVYLVDWGIAVSLRPDPLGRIQRISEVDDAGGTLAYMPPEMLDRGGRLGETTDVYLLGATLFEILVGRPPHEGESRAEVLRSILLSDVEVPSYLPARLAAIVRRAMSALPEDRFASADELRQRLEDYLRQRGSLSLSDEASKRVDEMHVVIASGPGHAVREPLHRLFAEARFGFRQAIRACPDNEMALPALREATTMVAEFELAAGQPEAAAAVLADLADPPPELAARVAAALRARDAEKEHVAELERLRLELDPANGQTPRALAALVFGAGWIVGLEVLGYLHSGCTDSHPAWLGYLTTVGFLALTAGLWIRRSLWRGRGNRQTAAILMLMFALALTMEVAVHLLGINDAIGLVLLLYPWASIAAVYALFVDCRFWPTAVASFLALLEACLVPHHAWHAMTAVVVVFMLNDVHLLVRRNAVGRSASETKVDVETKRLGPAQRPQAR
jgi:serine/threonine-protein kinase